jgi:hypothetical protein
MLSTDRGPVKALRSTSMNEAPHPRWDDRRCLEVFATKPVSHERRRATSGAASERHTADICVGVNPERPDPDSATPSRPGDVPGGVEFAPPQPRKPVRASSRLRGRSQSPK